MKKKTYKLFVAYVVGVVVNSSARNVVYDRVFNWDDECEIENKFSLF